MKINTHNYEEYFLLFADKELSTSDRKQVELFVRLNPAFEEEFLMIQQAILKPDPAISLDDKSFLLKPVPGKKSIYKNTSVRKVPLVWVVAAATFFVFGIISLFNYFEKFKLKGHNALQINFPLVRKASIQPKKQYAIQAVTRQIHRTSKIESRQNRLKESPHDISHSSDIALDFRNNAATNEKRNVTKIHQVDKVDQVPLNIATNNDQEIKLTNDLPKPLGNSRIISDRNIASVKSPLNTSITIPVSAISQPASYMLEDPKNDNYVFYNVTEDRFKKSKLGSFLRKVTRVIARKNPLSKFKNSPSVLAD